MTRVALGAIAFLIMGVPLAALAWQLMAAGLGARADFVIRSRGGNRVFVRGRVPRGKVPAIQEFCTRALAGAGSFSVRGTWGPGRALRLRWSGRLGAGQRQRIRNFLLEVLG